MEAALAAGIYRKIYTFLEIKQFNMNLKFLFSSGLGNKLIFLNQYVEHMKKKDI